jgi:hypothetical protein
VKFDKTDNCPAFTVFNKDPLVVVDLAVTGLPPLDRVTIPQFPYDMPRLYYVKHPTNPTAAPGAIIAGAGGCCAHSVRGLTDLPIRPVNFDELANGVSRPGEGLGVHGTDD